MAEERGERRGRARRIALALALAAPIALTPIASRTLADHLATIAGDQLAALTAHIHANAERSAPTLVGPAQLEPESARSERSSEAVSEATGGAAPPLRSRSERADPGRAASLRRGILVRSNIVASAVQSGARPSGTPVAASGMRPSGVELHGVSALGSGLLDGDVVTAVGGSTTTSAGMVIAAVAGAVRSGARAISAVIWRDQQEIRVTVEIPRIAMRRRADGDR